MADDPQVGGAKVPVNRYKPSIHKKKRESRGSTVLKVRTTAEPYIPLVTDPSVASSAAFAFPATAHPFNNIYELVAHYHPNGPTPATGNIAAIYDACVKMLSLFAIADLRHDFESELDIDIRTDLGSENIGAYLCRFICSTFYNIGTPKFTALNTFILHAYATNMSTDAAAKKSILDYLAIFYNTVIVPNRALFVDTAYLAPYDSSSKGTYIYENSADLAGANAALGMAYTAITGGNPTSTYILVDAQMGNPLERIFSKKTDKTNVIYNFTSAMDAASKPIASMHTYLNAYVQKPFAANTTDIPQHLTTFGAQFTPRDFDYAGEWKTSVKLQLGHATLTETFGPRSKASVDELALVPVRAGMTRQQIEEEVKKLTTAQLSQHQKIAANHIFKSLGDRLQSALIMKIYKGILSYYLNGNLTLNGIVAAAHLKTLADTDNIIEFTNDILASVQNYLMQVNTVFTGNKQVVVYIYNVASAVTKATITQLFIKEAAMLYTAISAIKKYPVSVADANSFLFTVFNAFATNRTFIFCQNHFLFKLFTGDKIPTDDQIRYAIKDDNYKSLISFQQDPIQRLKEVSIPPEISSDAFNSNIRTILLNIATLDREAKSVRSDLLAVNTFYNNYALIATSLEHYLSYCIPSSTFILTHLLIKLLAPNVSTQLYVNNIFSNSLLTFDRGTKLVNVYSQAIKGYFTEKEGVEHSKAEGVFGKIFADIATLKVIPTLMGIVSGIGIINARIDATGDDRIKAVYSFLAPYANIGIVINALKSADKPQILALLENIVTLSISNVNKVVVLSKNAKKKVSKSVSQKTKTAKSSKKAVGQLKSVRATKLSSARQLKSARATKTSSVPIPSVPRFTVPLERHPRADRIRGMTSATFSEPKYHDIEYITGGKIELQDKSILSKVKAGFGKLLTVSLEGVTYYVEKISKSLFGQRGTQKAGGSRSLKRIGAEELALLKVGFIEHIIGRADYRYAAYTHYMAKNFLDVLLGDYYAVRKSRSAPVSIRSLSARPLSVIVEEEEGIDYNAEGGSRPSGSTTVTESGSVAAAQISRLPGFAPGSRVYGFSSASASDTGRSFIVNPLAEHGSVQKTSSGEKVEFVTKAEGKEIINQQLLAFFWLGFSRSPEFVEMEQKVFSRLLPAFDISYIGDIQNEIFWQPLLAQIDVPVEDFFTLFELSVLPEFEGKGLTPIRRRLQRETQVRATTRRLPKK